MPDAPHVCDQCNKPLSWDDEYIIGTNPYDGQFVYLCRACINLYEYGYDEAEQIWKPA